MHIIRQIVSVATATSRQINSMNILPKNANSKIIKPKKIIPINKIPHIIAGMVRRGAIQQGISTNKTTEYIIQEIDRHAIKEYTVPSTTNRQMLKQHAKHPNGGHTHTDRIVMNVIKVPVANKTVHNPLQNKSIQVSNWSMHANPIIVIQHVVNVIMIIIIMGLQNMSAAQPITQVRHATIKSPIITAHDDSAIAPMQNTAARNITVIKAIKIIANIITATTKPRDNMIHISAVIIHEITIQEALHTIGAIIASTSKVKQQNNIPITPNIINIMVKISIIIPAITPTINPPTIPTIVPITNPQTPNIIASAIITSIPAGIDMPHV